MSEEQLSPSFHAPRQRVEKPANELGRDYYLEVQHCINQGASLSTIEALGEPSQSVEMDGIKKEQQPTP